MNKNKYHIGIDIGTSSIVVVLCNKSYKILAKEQVQNTSTVIGKKFEALQDPEIIFDLVLKLLKKIIKTAQRKFDENFNVELLATVTHSNKVHSPKAPCFKISGIGISNQMHGILYVNNLGKALSPLYTWQDKRGDQIVGAQTKADKPTHTLTSQLARNLPKNKSYVDLAYEISKYRVPSGYGLMTHFYNLKNNLVPKNAAYMLNIGDYIVSKLIGSLPTSYHPSNAQAWGFYNIQDYSFDLRALQKLKINSKLLLPVYLKNDKTNTGNTPPQGYYKHIPVYSAIGDNQAGILGAIGVDNTAALINVGTSAQISTVADDAHLAQIYKHKKIPLSAQIEIRPYVQNKYIVVASSLCGGKTIDLWVDFLASCCLKLVPNLQNKKIASIKSNIYNALNNLPQTQTNIKISPLFYGSRTEPNATATIQKLSAENFNVEQLSTAMMQGIVDELYSYWQHIPSNITKEKQTLYMTGGSLRIPLLFTLFAKTFGGVGNSVAGGAADVRAGVATPGVATPGVATPGVATPGVATAGVATPGVATPDVATAGVATPGKKLTTKLLESTEHSAIGAAKWARLNG